MQISVNIVNYKELSDLEILEQIQKFDSRALAELYDRYSPLLYTLIKKIAPDEITAESILVEVFAIIWRKSDQFNPKSENPYVWLVSIARNRAVDSVRRSRSSANSAEFYDEKYENNFIMPFIPKDIDTMDLKTALRVSDKVEKALDNLTDAQKYVIHLSYYEGFTLDEIADKLNIPVETIRNKVMLAMHNLRENLIKV